MLLMLKIGWRNLWRNQRRSLIILGAVMIGVWGLMMIYGLNRGWMMGMVDLAIMSNASHLQVHRVGYLKAPDLQLTIAAPEEPAAAIAQLPHVRAVALRAKVRGMISSARGSFGVQLLGVDPAAEAKVSWVAGAIKAGRFINDDDAHGIVIGAPLAERLQVEPGKKLVVYARDANQDLQALGFKVVGVYRTGNDAVDKFMAFVPLSVFQSEFGLPGRVHELAVRVDDDRNLPAVEAGVKNVLASRPELETVTWRTLFAFIVQIFDLTVVSNYIILAIFGIAISLGIANTMIMSVFERFREIGIMRAIGTRPLQIFTMVVAEAAVLAATGLALGSLVAYLSLQGWGHYGLDLAAVDRSLAKWGMPSVIYPLVTWTDWLTTWAAVVAMAVVSSLYPAIKAARKNPVEAMRA
jgi:putative ABC transport system permease protein